jgi:Uma2 family endonuclease
MGETGVLAPSARVELLEGKLIDMSPIGPFHGGVVKRLNRFFQGLAGGRWLVVVQDPIHLDEHSELQPDLMLLEPAPDDYTTRHPRPGNVFLLIEVSDTSLSFDRQEKLPAYGRAGVPEVWIINLLERRIEIYRDPTPTGYGSTMAVGPGAEANPLAFPDVRLDVSALLKLG